MAEGVTPTKVSSNIVHHQTSLPDNACTLCCNKIEIPTYRKKLYKSMKKTDVSKKLEVELGIEIDSLFHDTIVCTACFKRVERISSWKAKIKALEEDIACVKTELNQGFKVSLARIRAKYQVPVIKRLAKSPFPQKENNPPLQRPRKQLKPATLDQISSSGRRPQVKNTAVQTETDVIATKVQVIIK